MLMWKPAFADLLADRELGERGREDAHSLKLRNLPSKLFKYQHKLDRVLRTLETGEVWLAAPATFNDPFDSVVSFDAARLLDENQQRSISPVRKSVALSMLQNELPEDDALWTQFRAPLLDAYRGAGRVAAEFATQKLRRRLGVCCFSETASSLPMWAHYASLHSGACLEWDPRSWPEQPLRRLFPVIYDQRPFQQPAAVMNPHHSDADVLLVIRKAIDWAYEQEWRFVDQIAQGCDGQLVTVPKPTAVHLGAKLQDADAKPIVSACRSLGIAVYRTDCDLADGRLVSKPLIV